MSASEIITRDTLAAWRGTNAELARALGTTRAAVSLARVRHGLPRNRKGLSKTVIKAIISEAHRRGTTIAVVMQDIHAWMDGAK